MTQKKHKNYPRLIVAEEYLTKEGEFESLDWVCIVREVPMKNYSWGQIMGLLKGKRVFVEDEK
jgi:hypothetical protein